MKPSLALAVQYATSMAHLPTRAQLRKWVLTALEQDAEVTLRLVDEAEGRTLNRDYRGKDYATNVLTFPLEDEPLMGDIVLCAPVVEREASEQGKTTDAHYAHLVVHGLLHLQGYDHETAAEANLMESRESQLLSVLGYADPYLVQENAIPHGCRQ